MRRKLLLFGAAMLSTLSVWAIEPVTGTCGPKGHETDITWTLSDENGDGTLETLTIAKADGAEKGEMNDFKSTTQPWKDYGDVITTAIVEEGVTTVGDYAFYQDSLLTSVTLPNSLTRIGRGFNGCSSLSSISIPDNVTSIDSNAFFDCIALKEIKIDGENGPYIDIDGVVFNHSDSSTIYFYPAGKTDTEYVIPDKVTTINPYAFYQSRLVSVGLPDHLTKIDASAFAYCSELTSINIPDGVTYLGSSAFKGCSKLTSIRIPDGVTILRNNIFDGCSELTSIEIPNSVTIISKYAFSGCSNLTSIHIPDGVTTIDEYTFKNCSSLTSIEIPNSVTRISQYAFRYCSSLSSLYIPASLTRLDYRAFDGCKVLQSITVDKENETFMDIDGVMFSKSGDNIHFYPAGRPETEYVIPDEVTTINSGVFLESRLVSIILPDNLKRISGNAFLHCRELTSLHIPDGVTSIGGNAFNGCSKLTSIAIPSSVTSMGTGVFINCRELTTFICYAPTKIKYGTSVFSSGTGKLKIYVPAADIDSLNKIENIMGYSKYFRPLEVSEVKVNQNPAKDTEYWATYYNPDINVKINTQNVNIYKATLNEENSVKLTQIGSNIIKAGEAVMLKATEGGELSMEVSLDEAEGDYSDNDLKGGTKVADGFEAYTLAAKKGVMGFYKFKGELNANKAHLELPANSPSATRDFFNFSEDETSRIDTTNREAFIHQDVFDLMGRKVQHPAKGIYVKNGRKIIIK